MRNNITAHELKQKVLQLELVDQRIRYLFGRLNDLNNGSVFWLQEHSESKGQALVINYHQEIDHDLQFLGNVQGMVYLDTKGNFSISSEGQKERKRVEILLDRVSALRWDFFDEEKGEWISQWPKKRAGIPAMVRLHLTVEKEEIPFLFFMEDPMEPILFESAV